MAISTSFTDTEKNALLKGIQVFSQMMWGPTMSLCEDMVRGGILREIEPLNPYLSAHPQGNVQEVNAWIAEYKDAEILFDYLESSYVSLFVSNRKGSVIPLYESCYEYENAPLMGKAAAKMKERLAADGLSMGHHINEPPDHLAVELEYLYFLLSTSWSKNDAALLNKAAQFASNTMLPWVGKLRKRLFDQAGDGFYSSLFSLMEAVLSLVGDIERTN